MQNVQVKVFTDIDPNRLEERINNFITWVKDETHVYEHISTQYTERDYYYTAMITFVAGESYNRMRASSSYPEK